MSSLPGRALARNRAVDASRRSQRISCEVPSEYLDGCDLERQVQLRQALERVRAAISDLSPAERAAMASTLGGEPAASNRQSAVRIAVARLRARRRLLAAVRGGRPARATGLVASTTALGAKVRARSGPYNCSGCSSSCGAAWAGAVPTQLPVSPRCCPSPDAPWPGASDVESALQQSNTGQGDPSDGSSGHRPTQINRRSPVPFHHRSQPPGRLSGAGDEAEDEHRSFRLLRPTPYGRAVP